MEVDHLVFAEELCLLKIKNISFYRCKMCSCHTLLLQGSFVEATSFRHENHSDMGQLYPR